MMSSLYTFLCEALDNIMAGLISSQHLMPDEEHQCLRMPMQIAHCRHRAASAMSPGLDSWPAWK